MSKSKGFGFGHRQIKATYFGVIYWCECSWVRCMILQVVVFETFEPFWLQPIHSIVNLVYLLMPRISSYVNGRAFQLSARLTTTIICLLFLRLVKQKSKLFTLYIHQINKRGFFLKISIIKHIFLWIGLSIRSFQP